jgi:hypothetical protein
LLLRASDRFGRGMFFQYLYLFVFCFRLCASLMSKLALDTLLLQRLGVFW